MLQHKRDMPDKSVNNQDDSGMDPVLIVAIVLAVLLIIGIVILVMCWKLRSRKQHSSNGGGNIVLTNPNPEDSAEKIALAKSKLTTDPFMINGGNLLKGDDKGRFDELAQQLQTDKIKFLVILNSLRRDSKNYTAEHEAFYTYRECVHELSRFLYLVNQAPEGLVPDDGLYLAHWAKQILAIYDNERRIIAIPFNQYDMEVEEAAESFPIQQLRSSMRAARRSSLGSSEESSLNDSAIRVDIESDDEEEEVRNATEQRNSLSEQVSYDDDDVIVNPNSHNSDGSEEGNIIAAPVQFSKLNSGYY